ncbi:TadE/TadG family type IV pilus assembly protein [Streptomyces sp. NPDC021100]|uniref:TadE/TadG family type IV pilus assembly protein n=1 Tax=Streptomyces sp. NPDC021100 TaxID=3365114 RepID=UPI0037A6CE00
MTAARLTRRLGRERDRGSYAIETAVLAPVLILLIGLLIAFGRVIDADGAVDSAAHAAARAASLERDASSAQEQAQSAAARSLDGDGISCRSSSVTVNTADYGLEVGQAGTVTVTIACTALLSDIAVPGVPGSKTLKSTWTSPIDTFRARP